MGFLAVEAGAHPPLPFLLCGSVHLLHVNLRPLHLLLGKHTFNLPLAPVKKCHWCGVRSVPAFQTWISALCMGGTIQTPSML